MLFVPTAAVVLGACGGGPANGSDSAAADPSPAQRQCVEAFNSAPWYATSNLTPVLRGASGSVAAGASSARVAVARRADYSSTCLISIEFSYYGRRSLDQRERAILQYAFPENWSSSSGLWSSFEKVGESHGPTYSEQVPDSVMNGFDGKFRLIAGPRSAGSGAAEGVFISYSGMRTPAAPSGAGGTSPNAPGPPTP